jgi:hypothetical protein
MSAKWQQVTAAAFIVSVLLIAVALTVVVVDSGDASGPVTAIAAGSLVCFIVGMLGLRRRVTEQSLRPLALTCVATVVATIIGTTTDISGIALAVPIAPIAIYVIAGSKWRLGDAGILVLVTGMGTGLAYVLDSALHADTGSYGDQGALALIALGFAASSLAVALLSDPSRMVRVPLMMAFVLIGISFVGLIGAFEGVLPLVLALGAGLLSGGAWIRLGVDLWRGGYLSSRASESV